jgi:hypothetical protein
MTQASVSELSPEDAVKVEDLIKQIQGIYDRTVKQRENPELSTF